MFWSSIIWGLKILTFWEVYVAALIFSIISIGPLMIFGFMSQKNEAIGCLGSMLIAPIFQALATLIFVFTLSPILLGFGEDAAWSFPWQLLFTSPWPMIKAALIIIVVTILLAFIPVLGQIQSLHTFSAGAISLMMVVGIIRSVNPDMPVDKIHFMPGIFSIIGFLVIAGIVSWASTMLLAVIATALGEKAENYTTLIAMPLGGVLGMIPVFIYGSYLSQQLMNAM